MTVLFLLFSVICNCFWNFVIVVLTVLFCIINCCLQVLEVGIAVMTVPFVLFSVTCICSGTCVFLSLLCSMYYLLLFVIVLESGNCCNDCAHLYYLMLFATFAGTWVIF